MAQFKPYRLLSSQLDNLSIKDGQIIITTDNGHIYLDTTEGRKQIANDASTNGVIDITIEGNTITYTKNDGTQKELIIETTGILVNSVIGYEGEEIPEGYSIYSDAQLYTIITSDMLENQWKTVSDSYITKYNGIVTFHLDIQNGTSSNIITIPNEFLPKYNHYDMALNMTDSTYCSSSLLTNGKLTISNSTGKRVVVTLNYMAKTF